MKFAKLFRRAGATLLALATAMLLPSCFESQSTVLVKKDGSGTIVIKMILGSQVAEMMKMAEQQGGEVKNPLLDQKQMKAQSKKIGEGVEFVGVEELKFDDGRMGAIATYKFADIRKVKMEPGEGPPSGQDAPEAGSKAAKQPIQFDFTPGDAPKLTVKMPPMDKEAAKPEPAAEKNAAGDAPMNDDGEPQAVEGKDDPMVQAMTKMFDGMKISMDVIVDGEVTSSTATHREGSKVTLMSIDVGKMMANPEIARKMKSPDDMQDFGKFAAMAKNAGLTIEPKQEISVEFK